MYHTELDIEMGINPASKNIWLIAEGNYNLEQLDTIIAELQSVREQLAKVVGKEPQPVVKNQNFWCNAGYWENLQVDYGYPVEPANEPFSSKWIWGEKHWIYCSNNELADFIATALNKSGMVVKLEE